MKTEDDENQVEYWKLPHEIHILKMKKDDGLDDDCDFENTLPAQLGAFFLNIGRKILNYFKREINGFYNKNIFYSDTDSL